jgi:hypothetical protein
MIPETPGDRRPNDEPYFIDTHCECGEELVYCDKESGWFDEFECPSCQDGIHMDWPDAEMEKFLEQAEDER